MLYGALCWDWQSPCESTEGTGPFITYVDKKAVLWYTTGKAAFLVSQSDSECRHRTQLTD